MPLSGIELSAGIVVGGNKPVDAKFGPYASTAAALADIGSTLRYKGLTVGIENAGQVVEYWFATGVANADLVEKITPLEATNIIGLSDFIVAAAPGLSIVTTTHIADGLTDTYSVSGLASADPSHVLVSLNGVTQSPGTDYMVNFATGKIIFDDYPANGQQIVFTALGLRSVQRPLDPTLYLYAFDQATNGLTTYSGRLLNANRPAAPELPETATSWTIKRTTLNAAGRVLSTASAIGSWLNRETLAYA